MLDTSLLPRLSNRVASRRMTKLWRNNKHTQNQHTIDKKAQYLPLLRHCIAVVCYET